MQNLNKYLLSPSALNQLQNISQTLDPEGLTIKLNETQTINITTTEIKINEEPCLKLEMKVIEGEREIKRDVYVTLEGKTADEKLKELVGNRRIEREILLSLGELYAKMRV